jgi:hypothetical protein
MKKLFIMIMFCGTVCGVFSQQGIIKDLVGTVELKPAGSSAFVIAKAGDRVAQDTVISTSFKSMATITVGSTTLTVRPLTRLSLTEIQQSQGTEQLNVALQAGRVRVEVRPPVGTRADTRVHSPSATASVRGTEFEFDTYTVTVINGTVAYSGNDGRVVLVSAGGTSRVDPVTGRAADPVETSAAGLKPPSPTGTDQASGARSDGSNGSLNGGLNGGLDGGDVDYSLGFSF